MLYGADIASHQGNVDMWKLRNEGHSFVIQKCTGENNYVNPYYAENHKRIVAANLVPGSYDWVEPQDSRSGAWLAEDYLRCVEALGGRPQGHLLTVDFETPDWYTGPRGRNIEMFMKEYLYTLRDKAGQRVIVYTAPYFLAETGAQNWKWLGQDFLYWMAAPGDGMVADNAPWHGTFGTPWSVMTLHQHQWYAKSAAIGSGANFDRNRFNGTLADLRKIGYGGADVGNKVNLNKEGIVQEPPSGKFTAYLNSKKETLFVWNAGGEADRIEGINVQDLGVSVGNGDEVYDRSIQGNVTHEWSGRQAQAAKIAEGLR